MNLQDIANAAAEADDQTEVSSGFTKTPARTGPALLRLRDYIEFGRFENKNNPTYKPAKSVMLTFELLHPDHMLTAGDETFPDTLSITLNESRGASSNWRKLFNAMNYTGVKTHMSAMVGDAFLGTISHNKVGDKTYVNLSDSNGWHIGAPRVTDPLTNKVSEIPVPELHGTSKMFCWENPGHSDEMIKFMWDTLFIDGERNGKSNNWIQEKITTNLDWEGSKTQAATDPNYKVDLDVEPTNVPNLTTEIPASEPEVDPLAALGL